MKAKKVGRAKMEGQASTTVFNGFVVAIGASAGGLEALERFFSHCPADTTAAFVVIQHLSPDHKSMMTDLLARYTRMKVRMVEDELPIAADQIFLIPPGTIMRIEDGRFRLTPKHPHLLTLPIDIFFGSLADDFGNRGIGVILSGTGSDGTRGAVALNAAGGFLLAQEPREAKFDGMPSSVISTGLVDAVLSADKLATRILSYLGKLPLEDAPAQAAIATAPPLSEDEARQGIVQLLLQISGIDFNDYKPATLNRRIERRMQVRHMRSFADYLALLEHDIAEVSVLRRELLIPVTSFFRDQEVFDTLARKAIDELVAHAESGAALRVWVAGCSTGEEAYSIAIAFFEAFERARRWPSLKIFATDVNQHNVEFAAAGRYPESAAAELTSERLERFFIRIGNHYTVKPELRQCIVFARHNLLSDPPFTRMSLVSCRNTLIYFTPEAQKRALDRLQYAIETNGYMLLGSSESLTAHGSGFSTVHGKHKLFQRTDAANALNLGLGVPGTRAPYVVETSRRRVGDDRRKRLAEGMITDEAMSMLLDAYVPPAILVNERHEAIHLFGRVQPYVRAREGSASLELSRILPENLVPVASALLFKAAKERQPMVSDILEVRSEEVASRNVRLSVRPLPLHGDEQLLLLVFESQGMPAADGVAPTVDVDAETMARIDVLQRELEATRESLQATIEELETSNEELQATNEELMASNEELQSSNEELQSVNEELNTVNAEYQEKVGILNRLNADLDSMSKAVGVATVFVDGALNLTRFSPDAVNVFRLREGDLGRPLDEIVHVLRYPELIQDLRHTVRSERMIEKQALAADGRVFLVRILPYSTASASQHGAVVTFIDITATRERDRLQVIIDALPEHIAVLAPDGTIAMVNAAWTRFARANGDSDQSRCGVGCNYLSACTDAPGLDSEAHRARIGIKAVLEGSSATFSLQYPCHSATEKRWFVMNVAPIHGGEFGAVVSHINITSWYAPDEVQV
ncbi:chemotaxis protein CheB [Pseudothauera lacus]|uniref:protein-glutamate O-methyltransferase n=1 Tax=Pseudothauera lacus TaxID=2136175 RepID=A0A2T4IC19_9RHOO|nr:chemotaxis protein CheB [Pseudothauera lacus]PTD95322.1 chemotaxis protein CheR [Pseudothauera lacus]